MQQIYQTSSSDRRQRVVEIFDKAGVEFTMDENGDFQKGQYRFFVKERDAKRAVEALRTGLPGIGITARLSWKRVLVFFLAVWILVVIVYTFLGKLH